MKLNDNIPSDYYNRVSYRALGNFANPRFVQFTLERLQAETEITGYIVAYLNVSVTALPGCVVVPLDIDLLLTLRHLRTDGEEIFYTGITGEPVPLCKGWQRLSMRKVNREHPRHREWLPHRDCFSSDVLPVLPGEVYSVDVEVYATNVMA